MGLKKLNKAEVEALANKIKRNIIEANDKAREAHLLGMKASLDLLKGNIMTNLGNMSELTKEFIGSIMQYNHDLDEDNVEVFLQNRASKEFVLPYHEFEHGWRGLNQIKEAIVLSQLEAENIDGLIKAVTEQFKGV